MIVGTPARKMVPSVPAALVYLKNSLVAQLYHEMALVSSSGANWTHKTAGFGSVTDALNRDPQKVSWQRGTMHMVLLAVKVHCPAGITSTEETG